MGNLVAGRLTRSVYAESIKNDEPLELDQDVASSFLSENPLRGSALPNYTYRLGMRQLNGASPPDQ